MVWLTSLGVDCREGFTESCSIFFSLTPGRWGSLWCGGRFRCRGTCSTEVSLYKGLSYDSGPGSLSRLFGCTD
jgi:hypothetical protein